MSGFVGYSIRSDSADISSCPFLTLSALLAWHHTTRQPWKLPGGVMYAMVIESALLALALVGVARIHGSLLAEIQFPSDAAIRLSLGSAFQEIDRVVAYLGAGVYEEVLFRLLLVPFAVGVIRLAGGSQRVQVAGAIIATSLLFALAHHIGRYGDPLEWTTFAFRFSAGAFFAALFVWRGFGIAAGTHALYDIFVGVGW